MRRVTGPTALAAWVLAASLTGMAPLTHAEELVTLTPTQQGRAGVMVRPVLTRSFGDQVPVAGTVVRAPGRTVQVKLAVAGQVAERAVAPGDRVHRGQPLFTVESHEVHEMQADLRRAERELELARTRLDNGRQLYRLDGISRLELEEREQVVMGAELAFERHRDHLRQLGVGSDQIAAILDGQARLGSLTVPAPADGTVLELPVAGREWFEAYQTLAVVGDPGALEIELQMQPSEASLVARGDVLDFAPVGRPRQAGRAEVITAIPTIDPVTRTVMARARIVEPGGSLYPGVYVQGMLVHGESRQSPSVPEKALIRIGDGDYVFVQRDETTFEARRVELGQVGETRYEVTSGLAEGEQVVVDGVFFLKSTLLQGGGGE